MKLIVAVDNNWGIGYNGGLLAHIPEDMKMFKKMTLENKVVVMGRKTLESLPNSKPLKDRINIVLTRDINYKNDEVIIVHSIEECIKYLKYNSYYDNAVIIGGGEIYNKFIDYCSIAYITKIYKSFDNVDTYINNLDNDDSWCIEEDTDWIESKNGLFYKFIKYVKTFK